MDNEPDPHGWSWPHLIAHLDAIIRNYELVCLHCDRTDEGTQQ